MWSSVGISSLFFVIRIYLRLKIIHRLSIDDAFLLVAWLTVIGNAAIWQGIWRSIYFDVKITHGQITSLPPDFLSIIQKSLHGIYAAYFISYTGLWSVKISFLFFFRSLGNNIKRQRIIWWTVFAFLSLSYVVSVTTIDYGCLLGPIDEILGSIALFLPSASRYSHTDQEQTCVRNLKLSGIRSLPCGLRHLSIF